MMPVRQRLLMVTSWGLAVVAAHLGPTNAGAQNISTGIRGHWKLDETAGSTAIDSSGQGAHGTYTGTMQKGKAGQVGSAVGFSDNGGTTDRLSLPHTVLNGQSNITFSFWIRTTSNSYASILSVNNATNDNEFFVFIEAGGALKIRYHNSSNSNVWNLSSLYDGNWHHIVVVANHSSGNTTVYQNGTSLGTQSLSPGAAFSVSSGGLILGQDQDCVGGCFDATQRLIGDLDQVRIYNRVLSGTDIAYLYREGNPIAYWKLNESSGTSAADASGLGFTGTVTGTASWTPAIRGNGFSFNGSTRIQASGLLGSPKDITVAAWANLTAADTNGAEIISLGDCFLLRLDEGGYAKVVFYNGSNWVALVANQTYAGTGWHHFAAVFDDDANSIQLYVDGVLAASGSSSSSISYSGLGSNTVIGRHGNNSTNHDFTGIIDDVRVYNCALSASQIAQLYGLVGHWKHDQTSGTTATDSSPMGNNGAYTNGVTLNHSGPYPGAGGKAANFDGVNDYVAIPNESNYDFTDEVTVACWIKVDVFDADFQAVVCKGDSAWRLARDGSTNLLQFACSGLSTIKVVSSTSVNDGRWHHIVGVYTGGQLRIYVDGQLDNSANSTGSISTNNYAVNIGRNAEASGREFDGRVFDVRVYNRALGAAEIAQLYGLVGRWKLTETSGTAAADSSLTANNGTYTNGVTLNSGGPYPGIGNKAASFDGNNDHVATSHEYRYDTTSAMTVAAWVKVDTLTKNGQALVTKGNTAWRLERNGTTNQLRFAGNGLSDTNVTCSTNVNDGKWHHVVGMYDGSALSIYVDGVLEASDSSTGTITTNNYALAIAENLEATSRHWDGAVHDVRLYNRALSSIEVAEIYGLVGQWKLAETSGTTAVDSSLAGNNGTYTNGVTLNASGPYSGAIAAQFDGINDHVKLPTYRADFGNGLTLAVWARPTASSSWGRFLELGNGQDTDNVYLSRSFSTSTLDASIHDGSMGTAQTINAANTITNNTWRHYAIAVDSTGLGVLYRDGVAQGSATIGVPGSVARTSNFIGRSNWSTGDYFQGQMHDARVYNRPLAPDEVLAIFEGDSFEGVKIIKWVEIQ